jgi:hypothetical protein
MTAIDSTVGNALNPANLAPARQLSTSKPLANVLAPITDTLSGALAGAKPKPSLLSQFTAPFKVVFNALKALVGKGVSLLKQGGNQLIKWLGSFKKAKATPPAVLAPVITNVGSALNEAATKLPTL